MTIKRRLFISNILMLLLPVLLSMFIATIIIFVGIGVVTTAESGRTYRFNRQFSATYEFETLVEKWQQGVPLKDIAEEFAVFAQNYGELNIMLSLYRDDELVTSSGEEVSDPLLNLALEQRDAYLVLRSTAVLARQVGGYTLVMQVPEFQIDGSITNPLQRRGAVTMSIVMLGFMVLTILATNRFLTKIIVKAITTPLDILVDGVHHLRDGHLDYRIIYNHNDEFRPVCDDFNEMASQLAAIVEARRQDDENRRELIAGISHDLRTPLTSIKAYVEGLEAGVAATEQLRRRYLETIRLKAEDLEHIIGQLFLFSKLDIGEFPLRMECRDASEFLSEFVVAAVEEYADRGIDVTLCGEIDRAIIEVDVVQFRSALVNILENSLKYAGHDRAKMDISCKIEGGFAKITMSDNGPGVPEESLPVLFDVFYRTDKARSNVGQGSGLGLAITRKILNHMGGSITASNQAKGGLAMTISLPVVKEGELYEADTDN